jgi:hypothetical protein
VKLQPLPEAPLAKRQARFLFLERLVDRLILVVR